MIRAPGLWFGEVTIQVRGHAHDIHLRPGTPPAAGHFRTSSTWPVLRDAGSFTVNILPAEHQHLAGQFGRSGSDKFAGVSHTTSPLGNPVLEDALAWIDCELHAEYDGGDHTIVVAAVRHLSARQVAEPLLFFRGRYAGLGPAERLLEAAG